MQEGSRKAIVAAFLANLGIAAAKFVGFLVTASASLLAEAVHSLADSGNQCLLIFGGKRAQRRASREHQFGYARERYFWSFIVALVLFSMGGLFALYEGIQKLIHPHETESIGIAVAILVFAICLEGYSLFTAVKESRHARTPGTSTWQFIRQAKQPELPVVLLEDIGAEVGLLLALFGVTMGHLTGNARWDAVGSVAIGVLLVVIAVILAVEMKSLLIGESVSSTDDALIRATITAHPQVTSLIHLRTEHLGPEEVMVATKLEFARGLTMEELASAIDGVERELRGAYPQARLIFIEPDIARSATPR